MPAHLTIYGRGDERRKPVNEEPSDGLAAIWGNSKKTMMNQAKFVEALRCAARWHAKQIRKGTSIPYVAHLLGVASLVLEDGGSTTEAIAALLHDAVEDQGGQRRLAEIRRRFSPRVAALRRMAPGGSSVARMSRPGEGHRECASQGVLGSWQNLFLCR